jgi:hypothetical protein
MLPCISMASVLPLGETATDIEVPSLTVTSIDAAGSLEAAVFGVVCEDAIEANETELRTNTATHRTIPVTRSPFFI